MPTLTENLATWTAYEWPKGGDEWSHLWGGSEFLWWGTLYPRIHALLPAKIILEIAPGFGRCSHYLKNYAQHLVLVDLTQRCIDACKQRFADVTHLSYAVNDGKSLAMVPDNSLDFVFSFDSLVHAEADVLEAYVTQLGAKLKPGGFGFIHHSNLGAFVNPADGTLPFENVHWRAKSMSARRFQEYCQHAGLACYSQELISWGGPDLIDCFSVFGRDRGRVGQPPVVVENDRFMEEVFSLAQLASLYGAARFERPAQPAAPDDRTLLKKALMTFHRGGPRRLAADVLRYLTWRLDTQDRDR